jgi:hypothetical protein
MSQIKKLESELLAAIDEADSLAGLEEIRVAALGKKGSVSALMKGLGQLPPQERKSFGQQVNGVKQAINQALGDKKMLLADKALAEKLASESADITLPVRLGPLGEGRIHPISQVMDEINEIFADMGFDIAEGPDIEDDFHNFTALNIPPSIRRARNTTPSISVTSLMARAWCCEPIQALCRSVRCSRSSLPFVSLRRGASIVATAIRHTRRCFIRWRLWSSTVKPIWGILNGCWKNFARHFLKLTM